MYKFLDAQNIDKWCIKVTIHPFQLTLTIPHKETKPNDSVPVLSEVGLISCRYTQLIKV